MTNMGTRVNNFWHAISRSTALTLIGDLLRRANAPRAADRAYRKVLKEQMDPSLDAKMILRRAQVSIDLGNIHHALPMVERSIPLARRVKDYPSLILAYNYRGIIARKQSQWDASITYYQRALASARRFGSNPEVAENIYNNLGIALEKKGSYRSALRYLKKGLALARDSGSPESASISLNNIGIAYDNLNRFDEAIESYLESLSLKELIGYRHGMAQTTHNLGFVHEHAGKPDLAFSWYAKSLALKLGFTHDKHGIAQTQSNLGRLFRQKGDLKKARTLLQPAARVLRTVGDDFGFAEAREELARVEKAARKYSAARVATIDAIKVFTKLRLSKDAGRCRRLLREIPAM